MRNTFRISFLSILVLVLIGGVLRSPITAVSPVLREIIAFFDLNKLEGSLLTSIPLIVFASCSVFAARIALKFPIRYVLIVAQLMLVSGLYGRVYGTINALYLGSLMIGLGICIANVVTPAYIKNQFPNRVGMITGIFSVSMNLIAALASGFSLAIGQWTALGWVGSLGIWIFWGMASLLVIVIDTLSAKSEIKAAHHAGGDNISQPAVRIFRSRQAWFISVFMGLQSLVYYCMVAFLPIVLMDYGLPKEQTGFVLLVLQLSMLPVMFGAPILAARTRDQRWMIYTIIFLMLLGLGMLVYFKSAYIYVTAVLLGLSCGWAFSLSLVFFSLKSRTLEGTMKVSGKAQSVGYLIAAFGPPAFGILHQVDRTWQTSIYLLLGIALIMIWFGLNAAKARYVEDY